VDFTGLRDFKAFIIIVIALKQRAQPRIESAWSQFGATPEKASGNHREAWQSALPNETRTAKTIALRRTPQGVWRVADFSAHSDRESCQHLQIAAGFEITD